MDLNQILWNDRPLANDHRFDFGINLDPDLDPGWIFTLFQHGEIGRFYALNRITNLDY